ncbi:hypothetical protein [Shinella sp. HZN7]|uniref:hypothetical protein n=1 Tax=Shinella sp. (strain HZN7) TaxID=879274 RepID=UPI0007DA7B3B|nr:hypothetical protein [Shinella sp. HZN7]ANH03254.1 hypothetical protein shn_03810 [Shinella sp. HZN7]
MLSTPVLHAFDVTPEWLTSRTFTFRVEPAGPTISESFVFHRNGFIVGYSHGNEKSWELEAGTVRILDGNGKATCILKVRSCEDGKAELSGFFHNPTADYAATDVVHVLEENGSDYHARIQSFDLFDTLVARRCYDPLAVFRNVEAKSNIANFAARRHTVEMAMFGRRTYGLEDIYELLVAEGFLTAKQSRVLMLMELEEEWDTLFPIREVIAHVNPGDIIISDMYLPRSFIQRVLKEKCGLDNELYLSNYGKHHRQIWPAITERYALRSHFGDNVHADIVGPSEFGIQPILVTISKWSKTEEILHGVGLQKYAHALRQVRLQTFHRTPAIANALNAQLAVNIPLMLLGSFWIRYCAASFRADRILTAARDCNLWHEMLASAHFARCGMPLSTYIKISRTLCHESSDAYEAYLQSNLGTRSLLVDMVGTGKSLLALVERLGLAERLRPCILVADPVAAAHAPALDAFILKDFFQCRIFIEGLNASLDGSAVTAASDQHMIRILTQPNEFGDAMREIITVSRALFRDFLGELNTFQPPGEFPHPAALRAAAEGIVEQLPEQALKLETLLFEQGANLAPANMARIANA